MCRNWIQLVRRRLGLVLVNTSSITPSCSDAHRVLLHIHPRKANRFHGSVESDVSTQFQQCNVVIGYRRIVFLVHDHVTYRQNPFRSLVQVPVVLTNNDPEIGLRSEIIAGRQRRQLTGVKSNSQTRRKLQRRRTERNWSKTIKIMRAPRRIARKRITKMY